MCSVIVLLTALAMSFPLMSVTAPASMSNCGVVYPSTVDLSVAPSVTDTLFPVYVAPVSETVPLLPASCMCILEPVAANRSSLKVTTTVPL